MTTTTPNPLTVQADSSVLLERTSPHFEAARDFLARFAELEKCLDYYFTYKITKLSLWNAASLGLTSEEVVAGLNEYSRYPVPTIVTTQIRDRMGLYGKIRLVRAADGSERLEVLDPAIAAHFHKPNDFRKLLVREDLEDPTPGIARWVVSCEARGLLKVALMKCGLPVEDLAGYVDGDSFPIALAADVKLRSYQEDAVRGFHLNDPLRGGAGVLVLPCGAGKTIIGLALMSYYQTKTLIITPNVLSARQWRREILAKTNCSEQDIGEYSGASKDIRPITIATYQILSAKPRGKNPVNHRELFNRENWGLIIYDEVHLLPAPLFQMTAGIQARRRLGLTATLVREDNREGDVFCLIGPKKFEVPWKILEAQGWIAKACCKEVHLPFDQSTTEYVEGNTHARFRAAATNPDKIAVVEQLVAQHPGESILVIGMYLDQLAEVAKYLGAPLIDGQVPQLERDRLLAEFRSGQSPVLVISRVGNFSIDLPDASVAIEISGLFGSRQEEAQRLGRILRPKSGRNTATFYVLVSSPSIEERYNYNRQLFLIEQGYEYEIIKLVGDTEDAGELTVPGANCTGVEPKSDGARNRSLIDYSLTIR